MFQIIIVTWLEKKSDFWSDPYKKTKKKKMDGNLNEDIFVKIYQNAHFMT